MFNWIKKFFIRPTSVVNSDINIEIEPKYLTRPNINFGLPFYHEYLSQKDEEDELGEPNIEFIPQKNGLLPNFPCKAIEAAWRNNSLPNLNNKIYHLYKEIREIKKKIKYLDGIRTYIYGKRPV